jgi:hypothetical protein
MEREAIADYTQNVRIRVALRFDLVGSSFG